MGLKSDNCARNLTTNEGLAGCILSSARTQIPLVSFSDWYNMSWPSTFLLAIVNTLLLRNFCDTVSEMDERYITRIVSQSQEISCPTLISLRLSPLILSRAQVCYIFVNRDLVACCFPSRNNYSKIN